MVLFYARGCRNTIWLRLQSFNVKLLTMVLIYSGNWEGEGGLGIAVILVQNCFLSPNNFHDVDHRALVLSDGQIETGLPESRLQSSESLYHKSESVRLI